MLPYGGKVYYYPKVFAQAASKRHLEALRAKINWQEDKVILFGKTHRMSRLSAWYADSTFAYTYSNVKRTAHPWIPELIDIKKNVEAVTGVEYNSCLLNLYHNRLEGMGWHSDNESTIVEQSSIASLSFGIERIFRFKHRKTKECINLVLADGSLLEMKGETQSNWLHALPKSKKIQDLRINLTFRVMKKSSF